MIIIFLRITFILVLIMVIILCLQGIWWLARPLLPWRAISGEAQTASLMVEPFVVVQEGKSQRAMAVLSLGWWWPACPGLTGF